MKAEFKDKLDEKLATIEAVRGKDYKELLNINLQVSVIMEYLKDSDINPLDAIALTVMIETLGRAAVHQFAKGKDEKVLKDYSTTLKADVNSIMEVAREAMPK